MQQPPVTVQNTKTCDLREEKSKENICDLKDAPTEIFHVKKMKHLPCKETSRK